MAAQLIYAELVIGFGQASGALLANEWPTTNGAPRQASWEAYGRSLLTGKGVEQAGRLAHAYSALEDIAWLASKKHVDPDEDYSQLLNSIRDALAVLAEIAGLSRAEMRKRLDASETQTKQAQDELRQLAAFLEAQRKSSAQPRAEDR